jgi:hypothetical protein
MYIFFSQEKVTVGRDMQTKYYNIVSAIIEVIIKSGGHMEEGVSEGFLPRASSFTADCLTGIKS